MAIADADAVATEINRVAQLGTAGVAAAMVALRAVAKKGVLSPQELSDAFTEMLAHVPPSDREPLVGYAKTVIPGFSSPSYQDVPGGQTAAPPRV